MAGADDQWVTLPDMAIDYCGRAAKRRTDAGIFKGRVPQNFPPGFNLAYDERLRIDILGCRCEAAGKLYFNPIGWNAFAERVVNLPDLGDFIDIRGASYDHYRLCLQKNDSPDFAYVFVSAEHHPCYLIRGWLWGHECKLTKFWDDPKGGRPAYFVPPPWRPVAELRRLVHPHDRDDDPVQTTLDVAFGIRR